MKNNLIKTIKNWFAFGVTVLLLVVLFGIIFVSLDLAKPSASFFLELGVIVILTFLMKIFWYDFAEERRLNEEDIKTEKEKYFTILDSVVKDTNDLDNYLVLLNQENRNHYIKNKIGVRTPKNLAVKNWLICLFHPSYRKLNENEIGEIRYNKLYFKYQRKADKLKPIKSDEIMALTNTELLYDVKNYSKSHKRKYQTVSTVLSIVFTVLIASIAFKEISLNWESVFRYITYLFSIGTTIVMTIVKAYKTTGDDTFDWFNRLKFILDKYACYKEKEVKNSAKSDGLSVGICGDSERECCTTSES